MWPFVYEVGVEVVSLIGGALIFPVSSPGAVRGVFGSLTWKESDITLQKFDLSELCLGKS